MRGQRKNPRKAVQPFENKKRKIDIFKNYEANGFEKIQRKLEIFSTLISKKSRNDWRFSGFFMKEQDKVNDLLLANVFGLSFRTKRRALIELEVIFARFESLLAESIS